MSLWFKQPSLKGLTGEDLKEQLILSKIYDDQSDGFISDVTVCGLQKYFFVKTPEVH
jgi:hypothetical protein